MKTAFRLLIVGNIRSIILVDITALQYCVVR
jgi:hypothetical protein